MQILRTLAILIIISLPAISQAEEVTPSHVYQVTEDIKAELAQIYKATNKPFPETSDGFPTRQPRHVLQKSLEVLLKVHRMKQINNLEYNNIEYVPVMDVRPENVKLMVEDILQEVREIKTLYSISNIPEPSVFISGKEPTDVYGNLLKISAAIDGLMGEGTLPQNVYRTVISVVRDIEYIRKKKGVSEPIEVIAVDRNKTPTDVYDKTYILLEKLKDLTENSLYKIPGGILLPKRLEGRKVPADVQSLLNQITAELGAIKFSLGIAEASVVLEEDANKTPPDVYKQVCKAIMLLDSLL